MKLYRWLLGQAGHFTKPYNQLSLGSDFYFTLKYSELGQESLPWLLPSPVCSVNSFVLLTNTPSNVYLYDLLFVYDTKDTLIKSLLIV